MNENNKLNKRFVKGINHILHELTNKENAVLVLDDSVDDDFFKAIVLTEKALPEHPNVVKHEPYFIVDAVLQVFKQVSAFVLTEENLEQEATQDVLIWLLTGSIATTLERYYPHQNLGDQVYAELLDEDLEDYQAYKVLVLSVQHSIFVRQFRAVLFSLIGLQARAIVDDVIAKSFIEALRENDRDLLADGKANRLPHHALVMEHAANIFARVFPRIKSNKGLRGYQDCLIASIGVALDDYYLESSVNNAKHAAIFNIEPTVYGQDKLRLVKVLADDFPAKPKRVVENGVPPSHAIFHSVDGVTNPDCVAQHEYRGIDDASRLVQQAEKISE